MLDLEDMKDLIKLKSLANNDHRFKRYVYNITEEEQQKYGFEFIGSYDYEPDHSSYNLNTTYRNNHDKAVYIKTKNGWELFLKDGQNGRSPVGGGLGYNDVNNLITQRLTSVSGVGLDATQVQQMIDTSISNIQVTSDNIQMAGNYVNISGSTLSTQMKSLDKLMYNINFLENYKTKDYETVGTNPEIMYVGKTNQLNNWYVRKITTTIDGTITQLHANISNNNTILNYTEAWNNRLLLSYDTLDNLIF